MENQPGNGLPMRAMKDVPISGPDAKRISALVKRDGRVEGYQLEDGRMLTKEEGVALAKAGGILGVGVSSRKGSEYLKALPDGSEGNNLSSLPSVTDPRLQ